MPSANATRPAATATALPELDPPEIMLGSETDRGMPYGDRVPFSPVANWSRFVLPTRMAPASSSLRTAVAVSTGAYAKPGHAAVVSQPATSMLSFTANGMPHSALAGSGSVPSSVAAVSARSRSSAIQTPSSPRDRMRRPTSRITSAGGRAPDRYASPRAPTSKTPAVARGDPGIGAAVMRCFPRRANREGRSMVRSPRRLHPAW